MQRRRFVTVAGSTALVGLAGCLHDGDSEFGSGPAVVEAFYEATNDAPEDASGEEMVDEFDEYLHSESPIRDIWADLSADEMQSDDRTVDSVEAEVTEEDLSAEQLQQELGGGFFDVSDEVIQDLADDNAQVEATVSYENGDEETSEHFTAPEGGNWQVFL